MTRQSPSFHASERFREVRRLALPTLAVFGLGAGSAWFARIAVLTWLLRQTEDLSAADSLADATDHLLRNLALVVGVLLVAPLVAWQAASVLAPAAIRAASDRFVAYLAVSFVVAIGNHRLLLMSLAERNTELRYDCCAEPFSYAPGPVGEIVELYLPQLVAWSIFAAMVVPIYAVVRHHRAAAHRAYTPAVLAWCFGSQLMISLRLCDIMSPDGLASRSLLAPAATLPVLIPVLISQRYRAQARPWAKVTVQLLGLTGFLLAALGLVFGVSRFEGAWFCTLYLSAAGAAVAVRWVRGEPSQAPVA